MSIAILIVGTDRNILNKLSRLFKGYSYWIIHKDGVLLIKPTDIYSDISTYSNLSEDTLAILEFLPDFDTRYTYLLSLSLGIDA